MSRKALAVPVAMDAELSDFLRPFLVSDGPRYRTADWLLSEYDNPIWKLRCDIDFEIDWNVDIAGAGPLTLPRHASLWEALRSWLIVQSHVDLTGGKLYVPRYVRGRLQRVIHCIDYMLLNAESLGLAEDGLKAITENDLRAMVAAIGSSRAIVDTVYEWPSRLTFFLRTQIAGLTTEVTEACLQSANGLDKDIPDEDDRLTSLSSEEIVKARTWLWLQGDAYNSSNREVCRWSPSTTWLADRIYMHTLWGRRIGLPIPNELSISPTEGFVTEYPRAIVTSARDERMSTQLIKQYVYAITSLGLLHANNLHAPDIGRQSVQTLTDALDLKTGGRFRTLPHEVVFSALRSAIEFSLACGDGLVDSYLTLTREALANDQTVGGFAFGKDIRPFLTETIRALGVRGWTIQPSNTGLCGGPKSLDKPAYFAALRANHGLYECLRVFYGATELVVGMLMARRQGELVDLVAGQCLDVSRTRLVFANRKSGHSGMRQSEARPIPPVAERLIGTLERLQYSLVEMGVLASPTSLFAHPVEQGEIRLTTLSTTSYNGSLDRFCDWAALPLDRDGNRYYVRQHQLRRFFAMLFFWGGGFGGMDTLRWFLGHVDAAQLWHYITESTPGAVVRSVAAQWAVYGVKHATKDAELLGAELTGHFGTDDFSVLEEEALQLYIEDLLEEGRLTIEPQFLDAGRQHRIAVTLRPKEFAL